MASKIFAVIGFWLILSWAMVAVYIEILPENFGYFFMTFITIAISGLACAFYVIDITDKR